MITGTARCGKVKIDNVMNAVTIIASVTVKVGTVAKIKAAIPSAAQVSGTVTGAHCAIRSQSSARCAAANCAGECTRQK